MIAIKRKFAGLGAVLFAILGLLATRNATGQTKEKSPSDLIRFLSRPTLLDMIGAGGCGAVNKYRGAAKSLAKLGVSALPDIEQAVSSIEKHGDRSEFAFGAHLLVITCTQIQGPAAYPRLRRMIGAPKLAFLRPDLDGAVALSLKLTSYVSNSQELVRTFRCNRGPEPRDALDQFILAWERNDRRWLEWSLGPSARAALNSLLAERTWAEMRAELWPGKSGGGVAVGYRFEVPGRWSEPDDTLEEKTGDVAAPIMEAPHFDLDTQFTDRSGRNCGRHNVKFVKTPTDVGPGHLMYLVDNSDIGDLLSLISACAAQTGESP